MIDPKSQPASLPHQPDASDPERVRHEHDQEQTRQFVIEAARTLDDLHCEDIIIIDVRGLSPVTDYVLIASGTSDRQIRSVGHSVEDVGEKFGISRYGKERDDATTWVVLDFVDAVCHLFEPATRAHYDLEMMWGDAPRIEWHR